MLACHTAHKDSTFDYFNCVGSRDREYIEKTDTLNRRINTCVIKTEECHERCKVSFEGFQDQRDKCEEKCNKELYGCGKAVSFGFYEEMLKANKEWGKVKNALDN